jgi:PAS domain S-box-containing protein
VDGPASVREAIAICDPTGVVLGWTPAAERLYGWTEREMVGKSIDDMLHTRPTAPVIMGGTARPNGVVRLHRDRTPLTVELERTVCRGSDGEVSHVIDATRLAAGGRREDRRAGMDLYAAAILGGMDTAIVEVDLGAVMDFLAARHGSNDADPHVPAPGETLELLTRASITDCNQAARELLFDGGTPAGLSLADLAIPGGLQELGSILGSALGGKERCRSELAVGSSEGRVLVCRATTLLSTDAAAARWMVLCLTDVTDLREAVARSERTREYFQVIFETMPIALYRVDGSRCPSLVSELLAVPDEQLDAYLVAHPDKVAEIAGASVFAEVNRRGAEILHTATQELVGQPIAPVWTARMDTYRRSLAARLRNEYFDEETQIVAADGELIDVLFAVSPVAYAGERLTIVGMVDLRELRKAESELSRLQSDFAHAARIASISELATSLAHEVSQPLSAIHLCSETALRWLDRAQPDIEEARAQLSRIGTQAGRATSVINRVRQMTLPSATRKRTSSFGTILEDAMALVAPQARSLKTSLLLSPGDDELWILADSIEIEQVIVNLLSNALHAMEAGRSPTRQITATTASRDGQVVCVISDTGPGIDADHVDRLFDRFFTTKPSGLGLGLSICRTIAEAHGGSVEIANREDRSGVRSTLFLPLAPFGRHGADGTVAIG